MVIYGLFDLSENFSGDPKTLNHVLPSLGMTGIAARFFRRAGRNVRRIILHVCQEQFRSQADIPRRIGSLVFLGVIIIDLLDRYGSKLLGS